MIVLPWHESARIQISAMREAQRLPHALLIRAPQGWGEVFFANWLTYELLGIEPPAATGEIDDPVTGRYLAHPDLRWVQADGAVIKVDEIRMLAEFAVGTRQSAPHKVAVIESAQLMNDNSANALLKTLEEPPADTHIILTTSQASRLLPTIISRCQSVVLQADEKLAQDWLLQRWDEQAVAQRWLEYGRSPLECEEGLRRDEPSLLPVLADMARSSAPAAAAAELLDLDVDRLLGRWYRCCIAVSAGLVPEPWAQAVLPARLAAFTDELTGIRRQILYTNSANVRLLLERLAVSWRRMFTAVK